VEQREGIFLKRFFLGPLMIVEVDLQTAQWRVHAREDGETCPSDGCPMHCPSARDAVRTQRRKGCIKILGSVEQRV